MGSPPLSLGTGWDRIRPALRPAARWESTKAKIRLLPEDASSAKAASDDASPQTRARNKIKEREGKQDRWTLSEPRGIF